MSGFFSFFQSSSSFRYVIFRFSLPDDDEQGILSESIVSQRLLSDLNSEADKLKSMGVMNQIPYRRLVKVMTILQLNIKDGCKMVPINPVRNKRFFFKIVYKRRLRETV